ncbi:MAG: sugar transferase [Clostridiaceae bacterium]|nr:sugar transferase [Clostridiaceae bacterium]MBW4859673.1 sugar transferase [Clostridiaceae bacterium]MBW4868794.1 sugar transferase [Clostridiaceae bacterium]
MLKRIFDFTCSLIGLIILSPFFLIIAIVIKVDSKGPVFFKQKRIGKNGNPFEIYKFRTMVVDAESLGKQITVGEDPRITRVGSFLRKYKLDEFPQLINVLIGDMSLVGPRPEVPRYVEIYNDVQRKVLLVKPGITDYASIEFRNENDILGKSNNPEEEYIKTIMPTKLDLNLKYIDEMSFSHDIKLIFKTIGRVFFE